MNSPVTVPASYQIFEAPVALSLKDVQRLEPHLSRWERLNELFLLGVNVPDLERLVIIELSAKRRHQILMKLLGRRSTLKQRALKARVEALL